ncbi:MAG: tRNA lysidine(34) synthetase TilS [Bacteroidetes bacterium]|nr:tRNA lysidine(34) synthetase TilS [Bacteroidota bacterium]
MHSLESKVSNYIQSHQLFQSTDVILLACSGGSDSMALLHVLHQLNYSMVIAHANFSLRGAESDIEEEFVKNCAAQLKIPFFSKRFDTLAHSKEHGISIEMAAREMRYAWFEELRAQNHCAKIATAHHLRDSVETTLLNMIKGTGIRGMRGILPSNGNIDRPFSIIEKEDLEKYLHDKAIEFKIDSSNHSNDYLRNKIRNQVLPIVKEINPDYQATFLKFHQRNSEIQLMVDCFIREHFYTDFEVNKKIDIDKLNQYAFRELILFELLRPYGFNAAVIEDIVESLNGISGKKFYSDTHIVLKDRTCLFISALNEQSEDCVYILDESMIGHEIQIGTNKLTLGFIDTMEHRSEQIAYLDYESIVWPFIVRKVKPGDNFQPFGMDGKSKKLQDYFTDNKVSVFDKEKQWLLCDSDQKMAWIIGRRIDHRFRVNSETKKILKMEWS